jgi:hypothetical protein
MYIHVHVTVYLKLTKSVKRSYKWGEGLQEWEITHCGEIMFQNMEQVAGELVFILQVPMNERYVVVKCLRMQSSEKNVCCRES